MRCYRCGAFMKDGEYICPACGFDLGSPVEIRMSDGMMLVEIFDEDWNLLWSGSDKEIAYIDAPTRKKIILRWRVGMEETRNVQNGEAYRFFQTRLARGFVRLKKTRAIPKRKHKSHALIKETKEEENP